MAYTAQPSPTPTGTYTQTQTPYPQPAPAPSPTASNSDWNTQWNTIWNQAWNAGFNGAGAPSVESSFSTAVSQGYSAGQAEAAKRKATMPTGSISNVPTNNQPVPVSTPSAGPNEADIQAQLQREIDSLYGQSEGLFKQQEQNLGEQRLLSQQGIQTQKTQAERSYTSALEQAMKLASGQKDYLGQTQRRADSEALRNYNALQQSTMSRYGAGSSTGKALSEVIGQEFLRNQGNVRVAYQNSIDKVYGYEADANKTFQLATQKLEEDTAQKLQEIDQAFKDGLLQVSMNRTSNEQAKSAARIDLLQQSLANARAINNYKIEAQTQLETWMAQQKQTAADNLSYAKELATQAETNAFTGAANIEDIRNTSFINNQPNSSAFVYKPFNQKTKNNDESDYLNPWLA